MLLLFCFFCRMTVQGCALARAQLGSKYRVVMDRGSSSARPEASMGRPHNCRLSTGMFGVSLYFQTFTTELCSFWADQPCTCAHTSVVRQRHQNAACRVTLRHACFKNGASTCTCSLVLAPFIFQHKHTLPLNHYHCNAHCLFPSSTKAVFQTEAQTKGVVWQPRTMCVQHEAQKFAEFWQNVIGSVH